MRGVGIALFCVGLAGCQDQSANPVAEKNVRGSGQLTMCLTGPSSIPSSETTGDLYSVVIKNNGSYPIGFFFHPIWLRLQIFGANHLLLISERRYVDEDWPSREESLTILQPGEARKFGCAGPFTNLDPGVYLIRVRLWPPPIEEPKRVYKLLGVKQAEEKDYYAEFLKRLARAGGFPLRDVVLSNELRVTVRK